MVLINVMMCCDVQAHLKRKLFILLELVTSIIDSFSLFDYLYCGGSEVKCLPNTPNRCGGAVGGRNGWWRVGNNGCFERGKGLLWGSECSRVLMGGRVTGILVET